MESGDIFNLRENVFSKKTRENLCYQNVLILLRIARYKRNIAIWICTATLKYKIQH